MRKTQLIVLCSLLLSPLLLKAEQTSTDSDTFKNIQLGFSIGAASASTGNFKTPTVSQIFIESDINPYISLRLTSRGTSNFEPEASTIVYLKYSESLIPAIHFKYDNNSKFTPYLGVQYISWDLTPEGTVNNLQKVEDSGLGLTAGLSLSLSQAWAAHLEYSKVDNVDDTDISFTQIGISYLF